MIQFFKDVFNARRNAAEVADVTYVMQMHDLIDDQDTPFDVVDRLIYANECHKRDIVDLNIQLIARQLAGQLVAKALAENVKLRMQLIEDVTAALEAARSVNAPNGTIRKLDRMLTEALAAQPRPDQEESLPPADENGIKDLERDEDEVPADLRGLRDLDADDGVVGD